MNMPGFSAEVSLYKVADFYTAPPTVASFSFNREQVVPAQTFGYASDFPIGPVMKALDWHCIIGCQIRCLNKYGPSYANFCYFVSQDCCLNSYHCSYCN